MTELSKEAKYGALLEMASTDGWKIIEDMLLYDVKFATSLGMKPSPPKKDAQGNVVADAKYVTELHEIGRARGIYSTASKYLDAIKNARERVQKGD